MTGIDIKPDAQGKVRDLYDLGDKLLLVATDRISAFDYILEDEIPHKGQVLTQLSCFWLELLSDVVDNHLISADVADLPEQFKPYADYLKGRFMLVKKADMFPVECIVRGYLSGSGWKDYQATGKLCGYDLPAGLRESEKLEPAIFTPSTKAELGEHDENISVARAAALLGDEVAEQVQNVSLRIYEAGRAYAAGRGIIVADTKFEFGFINGKLHIIDEVLTPDSSRFWPADKYVPGQGQPSFDKQYLRDWLKQQPWNMQPPAPTLPQEIIDNTAARYREAYEILTGKPFSI